MLFIYARTRTGATFCALCTEKEYQPAAGQTYCEECPTNTVRQAVVEAAGVTSAVLGIRLLQAGRVLFPPRLSSEWSHDLSGQPM